LAFAAAPIPAHPHLIIPAHSPQFKQASGSNQDQEQAMPGQVRTRQCADGKETFKPEMVLRDSLIGFYAIIFVNWLQKNMF